MQLTTTLFGVFEGKKVTEYTLTNDHGVSLSVIPYGATVTKIVTPDREGNKEIITLNIDSLEDMVKYRPFYGATIGRVAGRIAKGTFSLNGKVYQLNKNDEEHTLHGGSTGLDTKLWDVVTHSGADEISVILSCKSPDGENGFPGNLWIQVTYTLTNNNEWKIRYAANTDETTLFNPTNHVYFNLTGDPDSPILEHDLVLSSKYFAPVTDEALPTGMLEKVEGTPFDFTVQKRLGEAILSEHSQIQLFSGLDHPFFLNHKKEEPDVHLSDSKSGRYVTMTTDQNSVVIFTHNEKAEDFYMRDKPVRKYAGVTLEAQTLPDAINQSDFGNVVLRPEEAYSSQTVYRFGVE